MRYFLLPLFTLLFTFGYSQDIQQVDQQGAKIEFQPQVQEGQEGATACQLNPKPEHATTVLKGDAPADGQGQEDTGGGRDLVLGDKLLETGMVRQIQLKVPDKQCIST